MTTSTCPTRLPVGFSDFSWRACSRRLAAPQHINHVFLPSSLLLSIPQTTQLSKTSINFKQLHTSQTNNQTTNLHNGDGQVIESHYLTFKADTPPGTPPTTCLRPSRVPPARLRPRPTSKSPRTLMPPWAPVPLPPRTPLVTRWTRRATRYVQAHDIFMRITG